MKKTPISSRNAEFQVIQALKLNRAKRHQLGEVFVEGTESIKQLVRAGGEITRVICHDESALSGWARQVVQSSRARFIEMSYELYRELCEREEPSELLVTARVRPAGLESLSLPEKPFLLILDRPSDTGNFGSLVRSANAFGVDAILLIGHGVDPYDPKTIRASLGSIFHTAVVGVQSMGELGDFLAREKARCGLTVVGSDSGGEAALTETALRRPLALALGNEAKGMSVALQGLCERVVRIPIAGQVNSLNLAVAGSILMWDVYKNSGK